MFGIALGYEDLNDHDQLRHDPMLAILAADLHFSHIEIGFDMRISCCRPSCAVKNSTYRIFGYRNTL